MSAEIRPATLADLALLTEQNTALAQESTGETLEPSIVEAGTRRILSDPSLGRYFVYSKDQSVIGQCLVLTEVSDWRNGDYWWLTSIYVVPSSRRRGILSALVGYVRQKAKDAGALALKLQVENDNKVAIAAYKNLGFASASEELLELRLNT